MQRQLAQSLPEWVPTEVQRYLDHTEGGISIRQLARNLKCHPSTVLRQVRRVENRRDDPLVDRAIGALAAVHFVGRTAPSHQYFANSETLKTASLEVLARLCQSGAVLAVADGMEKAVVVKEGNAAESKLAVDQALAGNLALLGWISCTRSGRLRRYHITPMGRTVYSRLMAERENQARATLEGGFSEAQRGFLAAPGGKAKERRARYGLGETPLDMLARLQDKTGEPFLNSALVEAGKRLREDFELAQIGDHLTQSRAYFSASENCSRSLPKPSAASAAAKKRAAEALAALGSGLNDIALRCCCHLEGLEAAERQLGWSARSGKIVLRIALSQLKAFYDELDERLGVTRSNQMIG
ncbi:MAG: helix-turn-helix domain containing protein [Roseobacter sp. MedPE-SW]|nr:MAG: helix-turn-helix domain containing protein [Roseobacter sp. MedPE-SW]